MSAQDRKAWERQQREKRIIDLAEPVFFAKGYEAATIIEIAKACGYNKRSIYLYFKDKEALFLAVVLRGLEQLYNMLESASRQKDIQALGRAFFDFSLKYPHYLKLIMMYEASTCVYQKGGAGEGADHGSYKQQCQDRTDAMARLMVTSLGAAMARGEIRTDLTPVQLMLVLWGQVVGVIQIILMRKEGFEQAYGIHHEALFDRFMAMVAAALQSVPPPDAGGVRT